MRVQIVNWNLGRAFTQVGLAGAAIAGVVAATAPTTGCAPAEQPEATATSSARLEIRVPAGARTRKALGVTSWVVPARTNTTRALVPLHIRGVDATGRSKVDYDFVHGTVDGKKSFQILIDGQRAFTLHGNKGFTRLSPAQQTALAMLKTDFATSGYEVDTDACNAAQAALAATAAAVAVSCAVAPVTAPACAVALAAFAAAAYAADVACKDKPKTCNNTYECTDKFGQGWQCNAGACVSSTFNPTPVGACSNNGDCAFPQEVCGIDKICRANPFASSGTGSSNGGWGSGGCTDDWGCGVTSTCKAGMCQLIQAGGFVSNNPDDGWVTWSTISFEWDEQG